MTNKRSEIVGFHKVSTKPRLRKPQSTAIKSNPFAVFILGTLAAVALVTLALHDLVYMAGAQAMGCTIKGNISVATGERIYHVPGQEYYAPTEIRLLKGERWFCSEDEARKAGWRRARNRVLPETP